MSKQVKQLTHRLKEFLYWKEETRKVSPALSVDRVSQTNTISKDTWTSTLERNRSHVISAGWVSHDHHTQRHMNDPHWRETVHMWSAGGSHNHHLKSHIKIHWRETAWMWSMWKNILRASNWRSTESSFKGETTFMFFMWKEFFTTVQF